MFIGMYNMKISYPWSRFVGVGIRTGEDYTNTWEHENLDKSNNNGLAYTVEVLEHIYTDAEFPKNLAPALNISLKASGKSRADLWALATIAAVEYGAETNNLVCDETPYYDNPGKQCNQAIGTDKCKVKPLKQTFWCISWKIPIFRKVENYLKFMKNLPLFSQLFVFLKWLWFLNFKGFWSNKPSVL